MMRIDRFSLGAAVGETVPGDLVLAELVTPESALLARDAASLHEAERELAKSFQAAARRDAFLAGRLALHAALREAGDSRASRMPVLRDQRGRPSPSWAPSPALSVAHTRIRAVAAVSLDRSCRAIGVDVEEVLADRAKALLRMAISPDERTLLERVDAQLLSGPIALWCARESCVKSHGLELGWFGSALRVVAIEATEPRAPDAEASWDVELRLESHAPMRAHAWQSNGAMFALSVR